MKKIVIITVLLGLLMTISFTFYSQNKIDQTPIIPENLSYVPIIAGGATIDSTNQTLPLFISDSHIDVYTTAAFQNFTYKTGNLVSIPIYFKFISSTKNSTIITIDPQSPYTLNCYVSLGPNKGRILINDYINYSSKGALLLKNGTLVQITMTINMPKGLWPYNRPLKVPLDLYGIDSEVPVIMRFKGELDE